MLTHTNTNGIILICTTNLFYFSTVSTKTKAILYTPDTNTQLYHSTSTTPPIYTDVAYRHANIICPTKRLSYNYAHQFLLNFPDNTYDTPYQLSTNHTLKRTYTHMLSTNNHFPKHRSPSPSSTPHTAPHSLQQTSVQTTSKSHVSITYPTTIILPPQFSDLHQQYKSTSTYKATSTYHSNNNYRDTKTTHSNATHRTQHTTHTSHDRHDQTNASTPRHYTITTTDMITVPHPILHCSINISTPSL